MLWKNFCRTYYNYEISVSQAKILTMVAGESLKEFPINLPENLGKTMAEAVIGYFDTFKIMINAAEEKMKGKQASSIHKIAEEYLSNVSGLNEIENRLSAEVINMLIAMTKIYSDENLSDDIDFERILYSQELVMLFAYLDAFMADSLRIICKKTPEILKSGKKIDMDTIISCGGWIELLDYLTERYIYEFGWPSLSERVEILKKRLGLVINFPENYLEILEQAENIRHIIVHNGGKVSQKYIAKTGQNDLVIGQFIPITNTYVNEIFYTARMFAGSLFIAVSKKFFEISDSELKLEWIFGKDIESYI